MHHCTHLSNKFGVFFLFFFLFCFRFLGVFCLFGVFCQFSSNWSPPALWDLCSIFGVSGVTVELLFAFSCCQKKNNSFSVWTGARQHLQRDSVAWGDIRQCSQSQISRPPGKERLQKSLQLFFCQNQEVQGSSSVIAASIS